MTAVLLGILTGIILMFFVGPSFLYLINISIRKGFLCGFSFAIGIIISDLLILLTIFWGLSSLFENIIFQKIFSLITGIVVLISGIYFLKRNEPVRLDEGSTVDGRAAYWYILRGFVINIMNPFTFMVWMGVIATVNIKGHFTKGDNLIFFIAVLVTVLLADIFKTYLAGKIKKSLTDKKLKLFNTILAVIFLLLSIKFLWYFAELMMQYQ